MGLLVFRIVVVVLRLCLSVMLLLFVSVCFSGVGG